MWMTCDIYMKWQQMLWCRSKTCDMTTNSCDIDSKTCDMTTNVVIKF